jgi:hypothetical protein
MIVQSKEMLTAIAQHKERRRRETSRTMPESFPDWRIEELAHKYAPIDAYEPDEVDDEQCD